MGFRGCLGLPRFWAESNLFDSPKLQNAVGNIYKHKFVYGVLGFWGISSSDYSGLFDLNFKVD